MKKYLIMALGAIIIGIGVAPVALAELGADSMTTFEVGLTHVTGLTLPIAQLIANGLFIVLLFIFSRKNVGIDTVLSPMFISGGCTVGLKMFEYLPSISKYLLYALGVIVIGLGIGIGSLTETGSNPYDGFVLYVADKLHKEYSLTRIVMDALLLVVGILMHGTYGIGTIISIACQGLVASFFIKALHRLFKAN